MTSNLESVRSLLSRIPRLATLAALALLFVGSCASSGDDADADCALESRCPNACNASTGVRHELCEAATDCLCGLDCLEGTCQPYTGDHAGCTCPGEPVAPPPGEPGAGVPLLGSGTHQASDLEIAVIGTPSDGLSTPRDLAFNPDEPGQLWVVCLDGPAMVIFDDVGEESQDSRRVIGSTHFMAKPAALAFGAPGTLATIHEEDEKTQPDTPADFMGPTLWSSKASVFDGGHGAHLDMLHNTPNGAGMAWAGSGNTYWVFDGFHSSLTRYEFNDDHGLGGSDHTDGVVTRFAEGEVKHVKGVSAHLAFDQASQMLYVADTGNQRVARLDTSTGASGGTVSPNFDGSQQRLIKDATLETLVDGATSSLKSPSGIALHDDTIFVSDNATSTLHAFALDGTPLDWVGLNHLVEPGGLMGIAFDPQGRLYVVDAVGHRVIRIGQ